jgi:hypothetical protein
MLPMRSMVMPESESKPVRALVWLNSYSCLVSLLPVRPWGYPSSSYVISRASVRVFRRCCQALTTNDSVKTRQEQNFYNSGPLTFDVNSTASRWERTTWISAEALRYEEHLLFQMNQGNKSLNTAVYIHPSARKNKQAEFLVTRR